MASRYGTSRALVAGGFHHVGITVSNMERSLAVYRDVLGLGVVADKIYDEDFVRAIVSVPGTSSIRIVHLASEDRRSSLELLEYHGNDSQARDSTPDPSIPGTGHLCFVVEDAQAAYEALSSAGVALRSPGPVAITEGSTEGAFCFYGADPDGYVLECFQECPSPLAKNGG